MAPFAPLSRDDAGPEPGCRADRFAVEAVEMEGEDPVPLGGVSGELRGAEAGRGASEFEEAGLAEETETSEMGVVAGRAGFAAGGRVAGDASERALLRPKYQPPAAPTASAITPPNKTPRRSCLRLEVRCRSSDTKLMGFQGVARASL